MNVLKKVKVNGAWKLCSVVVEPTGKLKDKVLVNGRAEVHTEGVYYIEWRENQQRRRQAVLNRHEVLEQARLKGLELDAKKAGIEIATPPQSVQTSLTSPRDSLPVRTIAFDQNGMSSAVAVIFQGIHSYLQELVGSAVESHLARLGVSSTNSATPLPQLPWRAASVSALSRSGSGTATWLPRWCTSNS